MLARRSRRSAMHPAAGLREASTTRRSRKSSRRRWRLLRGLEPTGAAVLWLRKQPFPSIRSCGFGAPLDSSPIGWTPFKLSADPMFVEKVRDLVGLYLNPPDKAIVLCVDEKSQTQALERSQPILPLRPGLPERQSHDYVRHGTLYLFAAYYADTGRVLGRCHQRHRHHEFLAFLEPIDVAFPDDGKSQLHLIIDNYSTHKTPKVHRWLLRHPRFQLHFTPTGSSWLNMVERFFARFTTEARSEEH